jgi:hypothetical protein
MISALCALEDERVPPRLLFVAARLQRALDASDDQFDDGCDRAAPERRGVDFSPAADASGRVISLSNWIGSRSRSC